MLKKWSFEWLNVFSGFAAPEHQRPVAVGLRQSGYHADWMCLMEKGGGKEGRVSSRDLLLALGWLLARGTLEKLVTQRVVQLDKTLLTPTPVIISETVSVLGKVTRDYHIKLCTLYVCSLSGETSAFQWTPVRSSITEQIPVAYWPSTVPGVELAVWPRRADLLAPCCV